MFRVTFSVEEENESDESPTLGAVILVEGAEKEEEGEGEEEGATYRLFGIATATGVGEEPPRNRVALCATLPANVRKKEEMCVKGRRGDEGRSKKANGKERRGWGVGERERIKPAPRLFVFEDPELGPPFTAATTAAAKPTEPVPPAEAKSSLRRGEVKGAEDA
jgi:hypothetical protein